MKNGVCLVPVTIAAGLVGFMSLAAVGEVETIQLDGMELLTSSRTYDITTTYITGSGGFEVSNNATLTFGTAGTSTNDFTGGIIVNSGSLLQTKNYSTYGSPYGSGPITLRCDGTARCQMKTGKHTISKLITTGDSTTNFPAINETYFPVNINEFDLGGDFYFTSDSSGGSSKGIYVTYTFFNLATMFAPEHDIGFSCHGLVDFDGKVTCKRLIGYYSTGSDKQTFNGYVGGGNLRASGNEIGEIRLDSQFVKCWADKAINDAGLVFEGQHICHSPDNLSDMQYWRDTGYVNLNADASSAEAYTQTFKWIASDARSRDQLYGYKLTNSSPVAATLVLNGEQNRTADASVAFTGAINLDFALNAPASYKQIFRDRESTMTGSIAVRRGELEIAGNATFANVPSVEVRDGATLTISSASAPFAETIDLYLDSETTINLNCDLTVAHLYLDGVACATGEISNPSSFNLTGGKIIVTEGTPLADEVEVFVGEGESLTYDQTLSGDAILVKHGRGTLVLNSANGHTGGVIVGSGALVVENSEACGSGTITIQENGRLIVRKSLANDIVFNGDSTKERPALEFDPGDNLNQTLTLSGDVTINGTTHFRTGWETVGTLAGGNTARVVFSGAVNGVKLAGAPHCRVSFTKSVHLEELEGYWVDNSANVTEEVCPTRGNLGSFFVSTATCGIDLIKLDQTRFVCGVDYCNTNGVWTQTGTVGVDKTIYYRYQPVIEFTCEHPVDGWGCYDMGGYAQGYYYRTSSSGTVAAPNFYYISLIHTRAPLSLTRESVGAQIVNTGKNRKAIRIGVGIDEAGKSMLVMASVCTNITLYANDGATFGSRTHLVDGIFQSNYGTAYFQDACCLKNITSLTGNNSSGLRFHAMDDGGLPALKVMTGGGSMTHSIRPGVVMPRQIEIDYGSKESSKLYVYGDKEGKTPGTLEVTTATLYGLNDGNSLPVGRYTEGVSVCLKTGTIIVFEGPSPQTPITWTGATDGSLATAANWTDGEGAALTEPPETYAPASLATFKKGSNDPQIDGEVNLYGLKFAGDEGMTVKEGENADLRLWQGGLVVEAGASARTFTVEPGVWFYKDIGDGSIVVPTGDTLVLEKGLVNATNVTVSGGGTLVLGGTIPANVSADGGTLAFAADAVVPDAFERIALANGGTIDMRGGAKEVTAAVFTIDGVDAIDGDYEFGNMTIHRRTGRVPTEPTHEATWDGGAGDDTALTTAANWVGDAVPTFDAGLQVNFAAAGEAATLAGEKMIHSILVTNVAEVAAEGPTSFTIRGATANSEENVLTLYGKGSVDQTDVSLVLENMTLATPLHEDQGSASADGAKTLTLASLDTSRHPLVLTNSVIEKPVYVKKLGSSGNRSSIRAASGVNELKGHYYYGCGLWQYLYIDSSATLILSGGATCNYKTRLQGAGTLIITNKPWVATTSSGNRCFYYYGGKAVFAVSGNYFGTDNVSGQSGFTFFGGSVTTAEGDFLCDYAFAENTPIHFSYASTYAAHLEFHDTVQKFSRTTWLDDSSKANAGDSWIHGDEGACFWVSNINTSASSVQSSTSSNACLFTGAIDVRKSGLGLFTLSRTANMISKGQTLDHTSTGTLRVDGGTLGLEAGVSWRNGPVEIGSSGTMKGVLNLAESGQLGSQQSLAISGDGEIDIPESVTVRVASATVGGVPVDEGLYTATNPGLFGDHLTGEGSLRVGKTGMMLILR